MTNAERNHRSNVDRAIDSYRMHYDGNSRTQVEALFKARFYIETPDEKAELYTRLGLKQLLN